MANFILRCSINYFVLVSCVSFRRSWKDEWKKDRSSWLKKSTVNPFYIKHSSVGMKLMTIFIRKAPKVESAGSVAGNLFPSSLTAATHDLHPPLRIQDSDRTEYVPPVSIVLCVWVCVFVVCMCGVCDQIIPTITKVCANMIITLLPPHFLPTPKIKILRRQPDQQSSTEQATPTNTSKSTTKSLAEREAEYASAR